MSDDQVDGLPGPLGPDGRQPSVARSLGLFWLYTFLRFGMFGVIWLILWAIGINWLIAGALAVAISIPLSWVLLARPRQALAANIEQRVNAHVDRKIKFNSELDGDDPAE